MKTIWANYWRSIKMKNKKWCWWWQLLLIIRAPIWMIFGTLVFLVMLFYPHKKMYWDKNMLCIETLDKEGWGGFEAGWCKVVCHNPDIWLLAHESGHQIQMMLMGDLSFLVSFLPSVVRYWYITFHPKYDKPYDYAWFEGTASQWGRQLYLADYDYDWIAERRKWDEQHKTK